MCIQTQMFLARRNMKAAVYKHFSHLVGKCFYAWSNYIYLVALGLDRKRWPGPRKYEVSNGSVGRVYIKICSKKYTTVIL